MNLRLNATKILLSVIRDGQSLTSALDHLFTSVTDPQQRAFIQAICYGVVRYYPRLYYILQQLLSKPLRTKDSDIEMLLLIGLYQLSYMRIKPYAAVSETVAACQKKVWAKRLINAVLRQYGRNQTELDNRADLSAEALYSHPQWLLDKIVADWGQHANALLAANNQQAPMVLRVNLMQTSREAYLQQLNQVGINASIQNDCQTAIILQQPVTVEKLPGFYQGLVSVQDTAAQLAATLLDLRPGQQVVDLCAAPGGKTAAILEFCANDIQLLAIDIDDNRLQRITDNLTRLKLSATVQKGDAEHPEQWAEKQRFDRILVDAPCSGLGVIRRHPDIKLLRRESDLMALQASQQRILEAAWTRLKPGGILLYATCSILKQENEQQIERFLNSHCDASEIKLEVNWGITQTVGRQILTAESTMDGFYYAKLIKDK